MQPDPRDALSGQLLDRRYRIGPRIARGGMATVYEALDTRLDREVAVKVMHPGLGDDQEFADRFVREAHSAARLSHPNVVGVFDQGADDDVVFLVMEYVPGHTLRDVIAKEAPMRPAKALTVLEPVVAALAAAHRARLIHRDVKPENVLIADDGRVKVADFGLARAVSADTQHTATGGVLIGTVSYLAPELVIDGRSDARADVYAVGVLLYELLTGRKPHEGDSPIQVAYKHVHNDVPAPSERVPGTPDYVDALVARATSRDAGQRPSDAGVLLHQLHRVQQALADGLTEDAELTEDLRPRRTESTAELEQGRTFVPAPGAEAPYEAGYEETGAAEPAGREHTSVLERRPAEAAGGAGAAAERDTPSTTKPARPGGPTPPAAVSAHEGTPQPGRRRGPLVFAAAVLAVVLVVVGLWWFGFARYTPTPGVVGMSRGQAVDRLESAGLDAGSAPAEYSESVPAGEVLSTEPGPGSRVLDGGTVTLVMSKGKERYDVPRLRGSTVAEAERTLADTKLEIGETEVAYSDGVPKGQVLRTEPARGTTVRPGALVDLTVSNGPRPYPVRDFTGAPQARVEGWAEQRNLTVEVSEEFSDDVGEGRVISQSPANGTVLSGDTLTLVVSKGPELVEVPDGLRGAGIDSARERLTEAGLSARVVNDDSYVGLGFVVRTSPESGEMVPAGSEVVLYVV